MVGGRGGCGVLDILGGGIGGIEAEAALLGQSASILVPDVIGVRLHGELPVAATATDLVLTLTERLRAHGVVGKIAEFHGPGVTALPVSDRVTLSNMSPEFGSTPMPGANRWAGSLLNDRNLDIAEQVVKVAAELGIAPSKVALAWVAGRPGVTSVVLGPRTVEQLRENLAAFDLDLPAQARARLDEVSRLDLDPLDGSFFHLTRPIAG